MTMPNDTLAEAVDTVFAALSDDGAEAFEALCLEHGLLWRCRCTCNNPIDLETCQDCESPRTAADSDEE